MQVSGGTTHISLMTLYVQRTEASGTGAKLLYCTRLKVRKGANSGNAPPSTLKTQAPKEMLFQVERRAGEAEKEKVKERVKMKRTVLDKKHNCAVCLVEMKDPYHLTLGHLIDWKGGNIESAELKEIWTRMFEFDFIKHTLKDLAGSTSWRAQTCPACEDCYLQATVRTLYPRGDKPAMQHQAFQNELSSLPTTRTDMTVIPVDTEESYLQANRQNKQEAPPEATARQPLTIEGSSPLITNQNIIASLARGSSTHRSGQQPQTFRLHTSGSSNNNPREKTAGLTSLRLLSASPRGFLNLRAIEKNPMNEKNKLQEERPCTAYAKPGSGKFRTKPKEWSMEGGSTRVMSSKGGAEGSEDIYLTSARGQTGFRSHKSKPGMLPTWEMTRKIQKQGQTIPFFNKTMEIIEDMKSKVQYWDDGTRSQKPETRDEMEKKESRATPGKRIRLGSLDRTVGVTKTIGGTFEGVV